MSSRGSRHDDDGDAPPAMTPGRRIFRYTQMGVYLAFALGIPAWVYLDGRTRGSMELLTWLLAFYMAARALAIFIKFRQETSPSRYTRAYVEARDLFPDDDESPAVPLQPGAETAPQDKPNGRSHG